MPECYILSCYEPGTHEVELRDARLTYAEPPADETAPYCADHADTYRDDNRCTVRSIGTEGDRRE